MNIHRSMVMVAILALGLLSAAAGNAIFSKAPLSDVSPLADPTDGAWAVASATVGEGRTVVVLNVKDLDREETGRRLGAHVHVGPCVTGDGGAAGGHYKVDGAPVSPDTEVWLDFTITNGGTGHAKAIVPFEIAPGEAHSIMIHRDPTASTGAAGPRLACIPLEF